MLAIIGGSGLASLEGLNIHRQKIERTPFGEPSGLLTFGTYNDKDIVFIPRHGNPHVIPPHRINYRANIHALHQNGVKQIIGINAVGGVTKEMTPCRLVIPDQIIDYTTGRGHTFFEDGLNTVTHIDFSFPYAESLRKKIINAAQSASLDCFPQGCYGATQGPRLETVAEIRRLEHDGCDLVGMTGMPEAALARELDIEYASICMVVNWAAGKMDEVITMAMIDENLKNSVDKLRQLLTAYLNT